MTTPHRPSIRIARRAQCHWLLAAWMALELFSGPGEVNRAVGLERAYVAQDTAMADASAPLPEFIGTCRMEEDGTVILDLSVHEADGATGQARFVYAPGDPHYKDILDHVGPLEPGESCLVRPWPDTDADNPDRKS